MSYQSVQSAISQSKSSSYVPPVNGEELGSKAFFYGIDREEDWPETVQKGWNAAFDRCADGIAVDSYLAASAFVEAVIGIG